MTRSIFDPTSDDVERSGSRFTGPDAQQDSHMPAEVTDGLVEADDDELPGLTPDDLVDDDERHRTNPDR